MKGNNAVVENAGAMYAQRGTLASLPIEGKLMEVKKITDKLWAVTDSTGFELFAGTNAECWDFVDNSLYMRGERIFKKRADFGSDK